MDKQNQNLLCYRYTSGEKVQGFVFGCCPTNLLKQQFCWNSTRRGRATQATIVDSSTRADQQLPIEQTHRIELERLARNLRDVNPGWSNQENQEIAFQATLRTLVAALRRSTANAHRLKP